MAQHQHVALWPQRDTSMPLATMYPTADPTRGKVVNDGVQSLTPVPVLTP